MNMSERSNSTKAEINALAPIPLDQRRSWISLAFVQAGICVCVPSFLLGALLVAEMPVWPAIISGSLGYVIVVVVMSILGMVACDLGRASCTVAQATFGESGARLIVSVLFAVNLMGWFGIQNGLCGEAFTNFMVMSFGISVPLVFSNILWGTIMLLTAVFGINALSKLDYVSIPYLLVVMAMGMFLAIRQNGMGQLYSDPQHTMSFLEGVGLSFNFYAVGTITAMDYTRFQKNRRETVRATVLGVLPLGIITLIIGVFLTKIADNYDISVVLSDVGIPILGVTCLILATWTTNSTNAYSSALDVTMAFKISDKRRRTVTAVVGVIGTLLGAFGILDHVEEFLSFLSFLVCPIGGLVIADYWIVGKGKRMSWHALPGYNWVGIVTWAVSAALAYLVRIEYTGIVFAIVIYLLIEHFVPSASRNLDGDGYVPETGESDEAAMEEVFL